MEIAQIQSRNRCTQQWQKCTTLSAMDINSQQVYPINIPHTSLAIYSRCDALIYPAIVGSYIHLKILIFLLFIDIKRMYLGIITVGHTSVELFLNHC